MCVFFFFWGRFRVYGDCVNSFLEGAGGLVASGVRAGSQLQMLKILPI